MSNFDDFEERTMTVLNYGWDEKEENVIRTRITLAPGLVKGIVASEEPCQTVDGIKQHQVNVLFVDSSGLELFITALDLMSLERCVGAYQVAKS